MSIFEKFRKNKKVKDKEDVTSFSLSLYQLKEHGGEIWLTYDGHLVCPCTMLNVSPVEAVQKMRELYVERTPKLSRL